DENGYVTYSNVDTTEEMIDLMAASNAYQANLTALSVVKSMITKTLEMKK
ncbi:MAG: flagellar basal body rod protein FlgC, partial [Clostridia bacterium]|nr:flagellar basal body rod protein FlgC [Clostridia bacterium]